jgi:hypothetical protein
MKFFRFPEFIEHDSVISILVEHSSVTKDTCKCCKRLRELFMKFFRFPEFVEHDSVISILVEHSSVTKDTRFQCFVFLRNNKTRTINLCNTPLCADFINIVIKTVIKIGNAICSTKSDHKRKFLLLSNLWSFYAVQTEMPFVVILCSTNGNAICGPVCAKMMFHKLDSNWNFTNWVTNGKSIAIIFLIGE